MRIRLASPSFSCMILIALLPLSLAATQVHLPNRGQKVYVVGVRDTRGLYYRSLCSPNFTDRRPLLDRLAPDLSLQAAARKEFLKERRYVLVDSAENADFVFIIEGMYAPMLLERTRPPGRFILWETEVDQKPELLGAVVAIAVPASTYRENPADWLALFQARIWGAGEGAVINASAGRPGIAKIDAKPERLVQMFPGKEDKSDPLCIYPNWERAALHTESADKWNATVMPTAMQPAQGDANFDASIKVDVNFVSVPVSASDADGKYILDLKKSDFHIFEDGVEQDIDRLVSGDEPLNAALMIDTSQSMTLKLNEVRQSALSFVESMRPADRLMVVSFDDSVHLDSEFTNDRLALDRAILATRQAVTTRLYDALDLVLTERLNAVTGRKAIVLFTDGVDTSSWLTDSVDSLAEVEESNVILYAVQLETRNDETIPDATGLIPQIAPPGIAKIEPSHAYGSQYLQDLSTRSGGRLFHAASMGSAVDAFAQVADELRHEYVLGYYPSNRARNGAYRSIRVTVNRPGVKIRARSGYRVSTRHATDSTHGIGK